MEHAIVIGGSMAGLATAAALASRFERVTIVERKPVPDGVASVAPHGRLPHVLLRGGFDALSRLLPGLLEEMHAAGATLSTAARGRWWSGGWRMRPDSDAIAPLATRGLLETVVRRRVLALPNVAIQRGLVEGLVMADGAVRGLRVAGEELAADLVVDCGGRGSGLPEWLVTAGFAAPTVSEAHVDVFYRALMFERRADDLDGDLFMVIQNIAPAKRLGLALAVENNRWLLLCGAYFGERPPDDIAGITKFAESLPVRDLADLIRGRELVAEPTSYRFTSSRRVSYPALPPGLAVIGDAHASFNPLYGQGMSVAALQAERLGQLIDRGIAQLADRAHRELAAIADRAWQIAVGADFAYGETRGDKPRGVDRRNAYIRRVFAACTVDPVVSRAMMEVQNMLAPPTSLLSPPMIARVLWGSRRARRRAVGASLQLSKNVA
ncbi:MAG TPA: hypothetical protein VMZ53_25065 [Kofleriaceae bacterium]|nr:hypothetical protein [Kofleriaceae bacterium]